MDFDKFALFALLYTIVYSHNYAIREEYLFEVMLVAFIVQLNKCPHIFSSSTN